MERDSDKARLEDLDRRLRALRSGPAAEPQRKAGHSASAGAGTGARLVTELLAGVLGGLLIGWFIDRLAGTSPWALIAGLILGTAGAFNTVLREARRPVAGGDGTRED